MSIFIENKYTRWYYSIINNVQNRTLSDHIYIEKHHIIPKSLGGSDFTDNLITLTAKEHFICHLLLTKMCQGRNKRKMIHAFNLISNISDTNQKRYIRKINSKIFSNLKEAGPWNKGQREIYSEGTLRKISEGNKGKNKGKDPWNKGKTYDETYGVEMASTIKDRLSKRTVTIGTRKKISESNKNKTRPPRTIEHREKLSKSLKGKNKSKWYTDGVKSYYVKLGKPIPPNCKPGRIATNKGVPHSDETKKKISETKRKTVY